MRNLEKIMYYFIKHFPQILGRTMLIKAIYLLDCEWYKSFGETYTGLEYRRDNNGPFDVEFYNARDNLSRIGLINEISYSHPAGVGYEFHLLRNDEDIENNINPIALQIADEIINELSNKDLNYFKKKAYETMPMLDVLEEEKLNNTKLYGRVLDMSKNKKSLDPLFSFDEIKEFAKKLDLSYRGSDEAYNKTVANEMNELAVYRERVELVCRLIEKE